MSLIVLLGLLAIMPAIAQPTAGSRPTVIAVDLPSDFTGDGPLILDDNFSGVWGEEEMGLEESQENGENGENGEDVVLTEGVLIVNPDDFMTIEIETDASPVSHDSEEEYLLSEENGENGEDSEPLDGFLITNFDDFMTIEVETDATRDEPASHASEEEHLLSGENGENGEDSEPLDGFLITNFDDFMTIEVETDASRDEPISHTSEEEFIISEENREDLESWANEEDGETVILPFEADAIDTIISKEGRSSGKGFLL